MVEDNGDILKSERFYGKTFTYSSYKLIQLTCFSKKNLNNRMYFLKL